MEKTKSKGSCPNCGDPGCFNEVNGEYQDVGAEYFLCENPKCGKDIKDKEFVCIDLTGGGGDPAHYHVKCFDMKQFIVKANGKPNENIEDKDEEQG